MTRTLYRDTRRQESVTAARRILREAELVSLLGDVRLGGNDTLGRRLRRLASLFASPRRPTRLASAS